MPTKPYSLQSPEQIAKDYAGNKQKIAMAAQSGLLDPTAAVMAGMFIDRMRSAQGQEQGAPSTVAQQVFAPPPPPMQMGAMPSSAPRPSMAPPMGAPQGAPPPPMGAPPVGMAGGGLTTLPLPDNMFNEPDGVGYAGGGIVAFAQAGPVRADAGDDEDPAPISVGEMFQRMFIPTGDQQREARNDIITAGREGRARTEAQRAAARAGFKPPTFPGMAGARPAGQVFGAPVPPAAPAASPRPAAPRAGVTPIAAPRPPSPVAPGAVPPPGAVPVLPGATQPPALSGAAAAMAELQALAPQDHAMRDTMTKRYADMSSPEAIAAQKKQDLWGTLAQLGFGMAGSNSPYFLQAAGQAGAAALPGMQQAAQARKAQEMAGLQGQLGIENLTNQERQSLATRATELSEMRRKGEIDQQQFEAQMALKREELAVDREYKRAMAGAAGARASRVGSGSGGDGLTANQRRMAAERNVDKGVRRGYRWKPGEREAAIRAAMSGGAPATATPSAPADYTFVGGKLVPAPR